MIDPLGVFRISYLVIHPVPDSDDASPFQGFGWGVIQTISAFARVALLPADIRELWLNQEMKTAHRMVDGSCRVFPLQVDALEPALQMFNAPFLVICSHPRVADAVDEILTRRHQRPIWHVRPHVRVGDVHAQYPDLTTHKLRAFVRRVARDLRASTEMPRTGALIQQALRWRPKDALRALIQRITRFFHIPLEIAALIPISKYSHGLTAPNETALESLGYGFARSEELLPNRDEAGYANAILEGASALRRIRDNLIRVEPRLDASIGYDTVLCVPSLFAHRYTRSARRPTVSEARHRAAVHAVFDLLAAQEGYAMREVEAAAINTIMDSQVGSGLMRVRQEEMRTYTAALAVHASAAAVPVVRLPPISRTTRDLTRRLADCARGNGQNRLRKLNWLANQLSHSLAAALPPQIAAFVRSGAPRIKIVSDAPLEWLGVDEVPLMLYADVSRVPATPGNAFFMETVAIGPRLLPLSAFDEVLVVRSFTASDAGISWYLADAGRQFLESVANPRLRLRVVDVSSVEDLLSVLNGFEGALLVFDGHGTAGSLTEPATIEIGGRAIQAWDLRTRARIPPLVFLSACDTHAMDASHATTANALLASGAVAVVATTLPVNAQLAGIFFGRLLLRLEQLLPMLVERFHGFARWSEVFHGLQRMVYVTEMLRAIDGKEGIKLSGADHERIGVGANMRINNWQPCQAKQDGTMQYSTQTGAGAQWFDWVISETALAAGVNEGHVRSTIKKWASITDVLHYVLVGNPEYVRIVANDSPALGPDGGGRYPDHREPRDRKRTG
jgi:hypothetical protein